MLKHNFYTCIEHYSILSSYKIITRQAMYTKHNIAECSCNIYASSAVSRLIPFCSKQVLCCDLMSLPIKKITEVFVKCLIFLPDFNQMWIFLADFHRSHQYQISQGYVHWEP